MSAPFNWFGAHNGTMFALIALIVMAPVAAFAVLARCLYLADRYGATLKPGDPNFPIESEALAPPDLSL